MYKYGTIKESEKKHDRLNNDKLGHRFMYLLYAYN
jgi:hypothetical protein